MWYISIATLIFVILAFGILSAIETDRLGRYVKPFVIIHIFTALGWLFLFSYQSWLALHGQLDKHKKNLNIGTLLVLITTIFSIIITYQWGSAMRFVGESRDVVVFAILFFTSIWAIRNGKAETHKRLMLMALLNLIHPAMTRVKFIFDWSDQLSVLVMLLVWILIPIAYDLLTLRKIHKATLGGVLFTLISFFLMIAIVLSPIMKRIEIFLYPIK